MKRVTSACANKMLRSLEDEKSYWVEKEELSSTYVAAVGEEPVIPEYDYAEVSTKIEELDEMICKIKHALNVSNANAAISVGGQTMSVDQILVRMAQLNRRKVMLDRMRKRLPKEREGQRMYGSRNAVPEYRYINYDLERVKADYERIAGKILEMQMALDQYNQTVLFEVEI